MDVEKIVREYIDKTIHLSLGTSSNNKPWVCEVHFAYDNDLNLYFRSLKSRRHSQEIAENPNVAGNIVDKYNLNDPVVGVYFEGSASLIENNDEKLVASECLKSRLNIDTDIIEESADERGHQFYKISADNWYVFGRFGEASGQKHSLVWNGGKK